MQKHFQYCGLTPWKGNTSNMDHLGEQGQVKLLCLLIWDEMGGKLWGGVCSIFQKHDPLVQQIPYAVTHLSKFLITLRWYSEFVATIVHRWNLMGPNESTTFLWNIFFNCKIEILSYLSMWYKLNDNFISLVHVIELCLTWACRLLRAWQRSAPPCLPTPSWEVCLFFH